MSLYLERVTPKGLLFATWSFLALIGVFAIGLFFVSGNARLSAEAQSESFAVTLGSDGVLPGFLSREDAQLPSAACQSEDSDIVFDEPLQVPLTAAFSGSVDGFIDVRLSPAEDAPFAVLFCGDESERVDQPIVIRYPPQPAGPATILVEGIVSIGEEPASRGGTMPLLRSGKVVATSQSYPVPSGRAVEESPLLMGDRLSFRGDDAADLTKTWLVARHQPETAAFDIVVQTDAASALVNRMGQERAIEISRTPSVWARLEAQKEWALILLWIALLANLLAALQHYMETRR